MSDKFNLFVDTLDTNSAKFALHYKSIGEHDYTNCTAEQIENIIISLNPVNPRSITTIAYIMAQYAKFLNNDEMWNIVKNINRNELWEKASPNAKRRFVSFTQFNEVYQNILINEKHNGFYKATLFKAIYEGVYNEDMSVIKNLRASDINGTIITLRTDDGRIYELGVSDSLAYDLKKMAMITEWERENPYQIFYINILGEHGDSCFKVERRTNEIKEVNYKDKYYRFLRLISKDYIGYPVSPTHLYISGIMHRVCNKLTAAGHDAKKVFVDHNRIVKIAELIEQELLRSGYKASVRNFKELVRGHLNVFFEE